MSTFKCKMCGGTLEIQPGESVAVCDSCGSKQTIPNLSDERRANLYDRANHFRRANEFDKAMGLYEQILNEDNDDAEAHWSVVLCRYGIEYVEDPATHKRVPTVNRTQYTSILSDEDYKAALRLADGYQRDVYQAEAKTIDEIQKGILAISQKEEPFDVFISYKETDAAGRRTPDSVLATDLYHQLTKEGFKVFLSRITLEDKLGQEYEPYIFAALNSAKVMVVVGTRQEYFNAVWVKNEWSRYLALIRNGEKKSLIPAYRDMDPYDLPDEFSHLMAQDMSKLGFMQDLIRGIKKLTESEKVKPAAKETVIINSGSGVNTGALLKRAFMFLEDGDWKSANEYCERVLDQDPENAQAYLAKLMAELAVRRKSDLQNYAQPFDGRNTCQKILRFADPSLKTDIEDYNRHIRERNEENRKAGQFQNALELMNRAADESSYLNAAQEFDNISGYKDADSKARQCRSKAEDCRKDAIYSSAQRLMSRGLEDDYKKAIDEFQKINGWRDSDQQIQLCRRKIEEIKAEQEQKRVEQERKEQAARIAAEKAARKRKVMITVPLVFAILLAGIYAAYIKIYVPAGKYYEAQQLMEIGKYAQAITLFDELGTYKDSADQAEACRQAITEGKYQDAISMKQKGEYEKAIAAFEKLVGYKDSKKQIDACKHEQAISYIASKEYELAYELLIEIGEENLVDNNKFDRAKELLSSKRYDAAYELLGEIGQEELIKESKYERARTCINTGNYSQAVKLLNGLEYKDSRSIIAKIYPRYLETFRRTVRVGDVIYLGKYEQDNNTQNGKEIIEWLVIKKSDGGFLVVSKYALDCLQYHNADRNKGVKWENCSLRGWLNNDFLNKAFDEDEKKIIDNGAYVNQKDSKGEMVTVNNSIFLLPGDGCKDLEKIFGNKCEATHYAIEKGCSENYCNWWVLGSVASSPTYYPYIDTYGTNQRVNAGALDSYKAGVRPAMWILKD